MPIAWLLSPYERVNDRSRRVAIDRWTPEIRAAGGYWAESEIDGDRAVVRARAPQALLAKLAADGFRPVDDPAAVWTPDRAVPAGRGGEIVWDTGERHPCRPLQDLAGDVLDDQEWGRVRARAELLAAIADRDGHARITGVPWPEAARLLGVLARMGYGLNRVSTGTFPTTGILDNFNRADEGPPPSASWVTGTALYNSPSYGMKVVSNTMRGNTTGQFNEGAWGTTFGPNSEVYLTTGGTSYYTAHLYARYVDPTSTGAAADGYLGEFGETANSSKYYRSDNWSWTQLGANITHSAFAAGVKLGLEIIGTTLLMYVDTGGGWAALDAGRSDATYSAAGYIGVSRWQSSTSQPTNDDFGGGTVVTAAAASLVPPARAARNVLLRR